MRDLNEILVFISVADRLSFDGAARELGLSASTVSRRIAQLERRLGVALLQRTTRNVRLTDAGATYRARCGAVMDAAAQADDALTAHRDDLHGTLRINAPLLFGQRVLAPLAAEFAVAHPGLRLHVGLTNTFVDPIKTGCDIVIRTGALPDSGLRARLLAKATTVIVASPNLLAAPGQPATLEELSCQPCIVFGEAGERRWRTAGLPPNGLRVAARFTSDDLEVVREAALGGVGFALLPRFAVTDLVDRGLLQVVALSAALEPTHLHTVFPAHPIPTPAAQALANHLRRRLAATPNWIAAG